MELTLFVEHQCNLRCTYCYTGEKYNARMSLETAHKAIRMALAIPSPRLDLSFFGGEPLIAFDLIREVVALAEREVSDAGDGRELRFIVNTNATLVDDEVLGFFAAPRRTMMFVSVDGARETHNRHRLNLAGRGSFDDVARGLERMRGASQPFQLVSVFGTETAKHLGSTVETLLALGATRANLSANYRDAWTPRAVAELREGLRDAGSVWADAFRRGVPFQLEPLHGKVLSHLKGGMPCPSRCQLAGHEFCVTPLGRIFPCAQMVGEDRDDALVIGHVDTGFDQEALARLQSQKDRVNETCAPCDLRGRCQSQCGCKHVALTGQLGEITEALCEVESAFVDTADWVAETLYQEQCPAFLSQYYARAWSAAEGARLLQIRRHKPSASQPT